MQVWKGKIAQLTLAHISSIFKSVMIAVSEYLKNYRNILSTKQSVESNQKAYAF